MASMSRSRVLLPAGLLLVMGTGCSTLTHTVGRGPQTGEAVSRREWFYFFGLGRLTKGDSATLANGAKDYRVVTERTPVDIVLNLLTSLVTVTSRTVTVTR